MENLFNQQEYDVIIKRLHSISPISESLWGKMNVNQMVVHLKDQLDISLGNKIAATQGPIILRTFFGKWMALYIIPWRSGKEASPKEMDAFKNGSAVAGFEIDKHMLLVRLKEFISASDFSPHPYFGKLNKKEWGRLAWKHFNHHLLQFGV